MAANTVTWESLYGVLASPHPFLKRISTLPGSGVLWRYIKSSHQNDPARTFLELLLVIFVAYTWLKSRTRGDRSNFVKLTEKVSNNSSPALFSLNTVSIAARLYETSLTALSFPFLLLLDSACARRRRSRTS